MQINSVASPSVSNDSVTSTSTQSSTPSPTLQLAQLAEDSVQLSAAILLAGKENGDLAIQVGPVHRPPP